MNSKAKKDEFDILRKRNNYESGDNSWKLHMF